MSELLIKDKIDEYDRELANEILSSITDFAWGQVCNMKPDAVEKIAKVGKLFCEIAGWDYQEFYYALVNLEKCTESQNN